MMRSLGHVLIVTLLLLVIPLAIALNTSDANGSIIVVSDEGLGTESVYVLLGDAEDGSPSAVVDENQTTDIILGEVASTVSEVYNISQDSALEILLDNQSEAVETASLNAAVNTSSVDENIELEDDSLLQNVSESIEIINVSLQVLIDEADKNVNESAESIISNAQEILEKYTNYTVEQATFVVVDNNETGISDVYLELGAEEEASLVDVSFAQLQQQEVRLGSPVEWRQQIRVTNTVGENTSFLLHLNDYGDDEYKQLLSEANITVTKNGEVLGSGALVLLELAPDGSDIYEVQYETAPVAAFDYCREMYVQDFLPQDAIVQAVSGSTTLGQECYVELSYDSDLVYELDIDITPFFDGEVDELYYIEENVYVEVNDGVVSLG